MTSIKKQIFYYLKGIYVSVEKVTMIYYCTFVYTTNR